MCVILICPPKVRPAAQILRACHRANPHGIGIAWRMPGHQRVGFIKGLSLDELQDAMALSQEGEELVIHFRLASVGSVHRRLTHPFPVRRSSSLPLYGTARSVLFHNGTWPHYEDALHADSDLAHGILGRGLVSDSLVIASLVARDGPELLAHLPGRFALFSGNETLLFGPWNSHAGMTVSNLGFLGYQTSYMPF